MICPRCTKTVSPFGIHTCTPTPEWYALEASNKALNLKVARLVDALEKIGDGSAMELHYLTGKPVPSVVEPDRWPYSIVKQTLCASDQDNQQWLREQKALTLNIAVEICESESSESNEGASDFSDGYDAACREMAEQIKLEISELRQPK